MLSKDEKIFNAVGHIVMFLFALSCILPFILLFMASFTDEQTLVLNGYSFFPEKFGFEAYEYILRNSSQIFNAYGVTILITVIGTSANVLITSLLAYPLSRKDLPHRKFFNLYVFFTMLFNGGLVPTYFMYVNYLNIKNTLLALLLPGSLLASAWYVLIMRTYMAQSIPFEVIESAQIDGAKEPKIFFRIVMPMCKPMVATIALFAGIGYWNDWYNGMIYVTENTLYSMQNLLTRMLLDLQYLSLNASAGSASIMTPSASLRMAIAAIGIVPIIVIYPFVQKNFVKGITLGAVKG